MLLKMTIRILIGKLVHFIKIHLSLFIFSACDECTQMLFNEIDQLENTLEKTSDLFDNYTTSSWTLLSDNLETYNKLHKKFVNIKGKADSLLNNPNILNLNASIESLQKKARAAVEVAKSNILQSDKLYSQSNDHIIQSKSINRNLTKLITDINNFGNANISLEEALRKAEHTQNEIRHISSVIASLQDNRVYNLCSRIKQQINEIYTYNADIPYDSLDEIENALDDFRALNKHIESNIELAEFLNRNNSVRITELRNKIKQLSNKKQVATDEVENILEKIGVTNDLLNQLEIVYSDLLKISKSEQLNELDKRIKRQMIKPPEVEELFLKSLEHVQELENKVKNYSR